MSKAPSNLFVRVATAVIALPLILLLLFRGPPWGFFLLVLAAALIGAWELFTMTHPDDVPSRAIGLVSASATALAVYFGGADSRVLLTVLITVPLSGLLVTLIRLGNLATAAMRAFALGIGPLIVALPLTLLAILRRDFADGPSWVLLALSFAWLGDTGGYFAGRFFGKRRLYEAVSPKKTVAGAVGGLASSALGAALAHFTLLPQLSLGLGLVLAVVAGAFGQAGDLAESLIKRSTGVKDSGAIVPGHGGILDRVDALLLTSTVVYLYTLWSPEWAPH